MSGEREPRVSGGVANVLYAVAAVLSALALLVTALKG